MRCVGIAIKSGDERARELGDELCAWLARQGREGLLAADSLDGRVESGSVPLAGMSGRVDLMLVLGGDGSLLHVARHFVGSDVPILGINLGRLGFLTEAPARGMFDTLSRVLAGHFHVKRLFALRAETWRGRERLASDVAINDVVLQRNDHPRMIEFEMFVEEQFVFRLRADGLILATPAGSTAYALSSGGPIVHPELDAVSVVPICPHTLSNRPVVVPAGKPIDLKLLDSPRPAALNLDGQEHMELAVGDAVRVTRAGQFSLATLPDRHYFEVLRSKLGWAGQVTEEGD